MSLSILLLILFTVTLSGVAQLALKLGSEQIKGHSLANDGVTSLLWTMFTSPMIVIALGIYGLSMVLWIWVLSRVDLSVAYPFVGVSFILTMAFGYFLLGENVSFMRMMGTVLIAVGCVMVANSATV
jgi:multidrug transporter EmrE-like cation transporter